MCNCKGWLGKSKTHQAGPCLSIWTEAAVHGVELFLFQGNLNSALKDFQQTNWIRKNHIIQGNLLYLVSTNYSLLLKVLVLEINVTLKRKTELCLVKIEEQPSLTIKGFTTPVNILRPPVKVAAFLHKHDRIQWNKYDD